MSSAIRDASARAFALGFYGGPGERESVEAVYRQGRAAIRLAGLHADDRPRLAICTGRR